MNVMERLRNRHNSFRSERPVVLGFLGDSVTHGCFEVFINEAGKVDTACEASSAYPALVAHELGRMFPFAQPAVINAGVSGDNAAGGRSRLARDVLFARPDLVFVNFGLNDSMNPDVEDGLRRYREAMKGIFEDVRSSGAECVLVTPNHMCGYVSHRLENDTLAGHRQGRRPRAKRGHSAPLCGRGPRGSPRAGRAVADTYRVWDALAAAGVDTTEMLANSINHPSREAHRLFVNEILRVLLEV